MSTNLERVTASQDSLIFDLDFERLSGDLMVIWSINVGANVNGIRYATCTGGVAPCT